MAIPAEAGIHLPTASHADQWIPAAAGMATRSGPRASRPHAAFPATLPNATSGGWVAGDRADLARRRDFEDLEIVRGAQLVVLQPAWNVDRVAGSEEQHLTALDLQRDP